ALAGQVRADRGGRADRELERRGGAGPPLRPPPGVGGTQPAVCPPVCAARRVSRNTDALLRHWCSSRRTISSPYLAVDFQCTRCSPSPSWYCRGAASSSPMAEIVRIPPSPSPSQLLCAVARGSG